MFIKNREVPTWLSHWRSGQSQQPAKLSMTQKHRIEDSGSSTLQRSLQLHLFITRQNILSLLQQSPQNHAFSFSISLAILRASSPQTDLSHLCKFLLCFPVLSQTSRTTPFLYLFCSFFSPVSRFGFLHKSASFYIFSPPHPPPQLINAVLLHSINPAVIFLLTHPKQPDSYSPMHPMHNQD
jgi:hypothetical protein